MATSVSPDKKVVVSTDPAVYAEYQSKWAAQPTDTAGWLQRAKDVASVLVKDAAIRERENKSPRAEVDLLKHSGLLKILGWKKYGGGEQPWSVGYQAIREVARGDGSIGMLLGYHLLWSSMPVILGSAEQADRFQKLILSSNYFVGGAVNPRDNELKITAKEDGLVFTGFKFFNTGGVISDMTVLEGAIEGSGEHIFALVETKQPGIIFSHDWDNIGLRLTESGSIKIDNVPAPWSDALGWDPVTKRPDPAILEVPFGTLVVPLIQLVFSNFYIGIAWGAMDFASAYTNKSTRAWPFGGDNKEKAQDEFYILSAYGNFLAHLRAATALADKAAAEFDSIFIKSDDLASRSKVTAEARGEVCEWIASVKVVATDTGLRVTSGLFEVTGARSTATKVGLDRFWRDIRTHTLHDPVAYKNRELGRYQLLGEHPEPSWYT
ncbi:DBT sulfur dioxygenase [Cladobotryum mycophilum]|uniref:DBT sulfur dioxygenase n=1 Tax=Cladobotryum mycophilum TaxID=491253 RepID=A0ABR0T3T0_9HYPO